MPRPPLCMVCEPDTVAAVEDIRGFKIGAEGRERLRFSGADFFVRVSSDSTGGAFAIIEEIDPLDTPLYVHANEDEFWFVLEGEHVIQVGEDELSCGSR